MLDAIFLKIVKCIIKLFQVIEAKFGLNTKYQLCPMSVSELPSIGSILIKSNKKEINPLFYSITKLLKMSLKDKAESSDQELTIYHNIKRIQFFLRVHVFLIQI